MKRIRLSLAAVLSAFYLMVSAQSNYADLEKSFQICAVGTYHFDQMQGFGDRVEDHYHSSTCALKETNSVWLTFTTAEEGELTFIIEPDQEFDDIDFIVFSADQTTITPIRTMTSGENVGRSGNNIRCFGFSGLHFSSDDIFEDRGCAHSDDNFLKPIHCGAGLTYFILVNNYESNAGFSISIQSDADFIDVDGSCQRANPEFAASQIFPNPVDKLLNIRLPQEDQVRNWKIFSSNGKLVEEGRQLHKNQDGVHNLSVARLLPGSYVINIESNHFSYSFSFIKI